MVASARILFLLILWQLRIVYMDQQMISFNHANSSGISISREKPSIKSPTISTITLVRNYLNIESLIVVNQTSPVKPLFGKTNVSINSPTFINTKSSQLRPVPPSSRHQLNITTKDKPTNKSDTFVALVGQNFSLPCDISGEHNDDTIILILWYKNDSVKPIYTVDARGSSQKDVIHSSESPNRLNFTIHYPISTLFISTVEKEDEGDYKCRIDYRVGRTIYRTVKLTVLDFPEDEGEESEYRRDPSSWPQYIAIVGTNADLHCNTTSPTKDDSVALILWYKDDVGHPLYSIDARSSDNLSDAKHFYSSERAKLNLTDSISTLTLSPVKEQDAGEYRCRVDFKRGRTINRFLNFQVIVPIKQLVISSDNGHKIKDIGGPFNEGQPLQLTCEAQGGKPSPVITWYRGSTIIDDTYFMSSDGSSLNILHLPPLKRDDLMMIITCKAINNNITDPISHSIAIDLNLKPKEVRIIKPTSELTIGKTAELVCQSTGSKPSAHIKWKIGSNVFNSIGESTSDDGSVTTSFLSFVPSIDDNGKKLTCSAWNPMFTEEALHDEIILNISYVPIVYLAMGVSSRNEKILAGSDIFFECNIQANPSANKMGWLFNDKPLASNSSANILVQNNSLLIKDVWKNHEGRYKCWAANSEGQGSSDSIDLNIQFAPVCSGNHRVHFGAASGEQVEITCEVDADPPEVKFTWSFNETSPPLSSSPSLTSPLSSSLTSSSLTSSTNYNIDSLSLDYSQSGLKSTATFTPKSMSDYGVLFCWATNSIGLSKEPCRFYIIPAGPPDPPENCTIANITMVSLTVSCWPGYNGGLEQRYHLEMHLDNLDGPLIQNQSTTDYPFFIVKSLSSGNPYIINIYATNLKGRSDSVVLRGSTQLQAQWHTTDSVDDIVINPMTLMLLVALGAFMVLGCLTMLIIKLKRSKRRSDDSVKIAMNTISDERLQGILMDQECSGINYGSDIGINHVTKFCNNHGSDLYDDHKTLDTIIVPHSVDANFHQICLENQDLTLSNHDNDKQTNEMLHVCHVGEGLIGASPLFIEHIYCHQDDSRSGHSSSDLYFRDMVG